jgi:hypothetical protein
MISPVRLLDVVSPMAAILPEYYHDEADINAALDHGVANCAVRAYAGGLLLRDSYPNQDLYVIEFGFAPEHGGEHLGENGLYTRMGHAATRFFVPGNSPMILESYTDSKLEVVTPSDEHVGYTWMSLDEGYRAYLDLAGHDDIEIDPDDILKLVQKRIEAEQLAIEGEEPLV